MTKLHGYMSDRGYSLSGVLIKLAMEAEQDVESQAGSSARMDGRRPLYGEIWSANIPFKVRIFAWPLSQDVPC
jgi:hypothetical protein